MHANTWNSLGGAGAADVASGRLLGGRFRLEQTIGRGAFGTVWRARDVLFERDVAVKILPALRQDEVATVRREAAALRVARLPGVARLLEADLEPGFGWLAMELVSGRPFPGGDAPVPWEILAPLAQALLSTLGGLHGAGILHRDLKPGNVLMDGNDVVLLDLGLARGARVRTEAAGKAVVEGTPAYAAPEQRLGEEATRRTDLWAVGMLLHEALAGRHPWSGVDPMALILGEDVPEIPALASTAPDVPRVVAEAVDRMLSEDPAERPATAWDAWVALAGTETLPALPTPGGPLPEPGSLEPLFWDPGAFHHLDEDGAVALVRWCSQRDVSVVAGVRTWLREGRVTLRDGKLHVTRDQLLRLELEEHRAEDPVARIEAAWRASRYRHVVALAEQCILEGSVPGARLEEAVTWGVLAALREDRLDALEGGLRLVHLVLEEPWTEPLRLVLDAAAAARRHHMDRARELLGRVPEDVSPRLRERVMVLAARIARLEGVEAEDAEVRSWAAEAARDPSLRGVWLTLLGLVRYRQHRFDEAADLSSQAAAMTSTEAGRWILATNTVQALLDGGEVEDSLRLAREVERGARHHRMGLQQVRARYLRRAAAYRLGHLDSDGPDWTAVRGALALDARWGALTCLPEAACAWRCGRPAEAVRLARLGAVAARSLSHALLTHLFDALRFHLADDRLSTRADDLVGYGTDCPAPAVGVQILGLVAGRDRASVPDGVAHAVASMVPRSTWSRRREFLSVEEALSLCEPRRSSPSSSIHDPGVPHG